MSQHVTDFLEYLNGEEERAFLAEEKRLDTARAELLNKYNNLVSERISRNVLLAEIYNLLASSSPEMATILDKMDNKALQTFLSMVLLMNKVKE